MIFDSDKICTGNSFHANNNSGASNIHHRAAISGLVDPLSFSAINFLRTYNRLIGPNELSQCYNLTLLNENRNARNIALPLPPLPLQSILTTNSLTTVIPPTSTQQPAALLEPSRLHSLCQLQNPLHASDEPTDTHTNHLRLQSPPNRTVSSTCPSTPSDFNCEIKQTSGVPPILNHQQFPIGTQLSPNFIRRQRGEKRPIPDEQKDEKYYERRKRNNEAAKKSRDARKMREDRVAFRAAMLEQENAILRAQLLAQREEITTLRQLLCTRP